MAYIPRYEAAKEIRQVLVDFDTAQHQWNTYADMLGKAYATAFTRHTDVFDEMAKDLKPSKGDRAFYFLFSLFSVGFGGGLVGGLMAPWVRGAGNVTGELVFRTTMSNATRQITGTVLQEGFKQLFSAESNPYTPAVLDPLIYYLDVKIEIGKCFSILRDKVEKEMIEADTDFSNSGAPESWGRQRREFWNSVPIVNEYPRTEDMPNIEEAARQAELGMWITWATTKFNYQEEVNRMNWVKYEPHLMREETKWRRFELRFVRIKQRLEQLGVGNFTTDTYKEFGEIIYVLSIPRLVNLGEHLGGTFFGNINKVVKYSDSAPKTLSNLISTPPIFKRGNKNRLPVVRAGATAIRK